MRNGSVFIGHPPQVYVPITMQPRIGPAWLKLDGRRFRWTATPVWAQGLGEYDGLVGLDWEWLAMDGAITKAPLGGKKTGPNPTDRAKRGTKRSVMTEASGIPVGVAVDGANRNDFKMARETNGAVGTSGKK